MAAPGLDVAVRDLVWLVRGFAGWSLEVFFVGSSADLISQYQPRLNVVEQERFLASLDIYRLVLNTEPLSRLFLSADFASTSPANPSTGTKPNLCLTGSGGPHLKSSLSSQIGGLQFEACGSFEELPTHQSSLSFPAKHANAAWEAKGLGTGILDPESPKPIRDDDQVRPDLQSSHRQVRVFLGLTSQSTESQSSDERALFLGPMRAMRSPLPIPLLIPSKYPVTRSPRVRNLDAVCAPSASASELPMPYQFASGFSLSVHAASIGKVAMDGHGFVEPTVVTCLVPFTANLTPLLRVSFPDLTSFLHQHCEASSPP
ncbi:hypothetical protein FPANT_2035 [Fusarium pseudoanthophilum]|uniref:Uncharacterized protein n=1 Tax=Fusarium pseudoanthophilum TaxID=48495 RepID=A0A8H5PPL0_9HYPO|nr:hypothetical protein FPANT_2035 [Fusarium pseudoanthophilum]